MKIFLCDLRRIDIKNSYENLIGRFDEKTRQEIERFKFQEGRYTAFARELLLRGVLFDTFGEGTFTLSKNTYGKPYIKDITLSKNGADVKKDTEGFEFNISHSGDMVTIIYGKGPAGIDVERDDRVKDHEKLLRFLYEKERRQVVSSPEPQKEFCRIWTYREALSKEEGVGLSLFEEEEKEIVIDYGNNKVTVNGVECCFYEYICPGYHMTVCIRGMTERPDLFEIDKKKWDEITLEFAKIHINVIS